MRRKLRANYCFMASGLQSPVTGCQLPVTGWGFPVTGCLLPVTSCGFPVSCYRLPVGRYRSGVVPVTGCLLPLAIDDLKHSEQETPGAFRKVDLFLLRLGAIARNS